MEYGIFTFHQLSQCSFSLAIRRYLISIAIAREFDYIEGVWESLSWAWYQAVMTELKYI